MHVIILCMNCLLVPVHCTFQHFELYEVRVLWIPFCSILFVYLFMIIFNDHCSHSIHRIGNGVERGRGRERERGRERGREREGERERDDFIL